jgi:hypothetical protein
MDQNLLNGCFRIRELGRNLACLSRQFTASADRRFEFQKRSHLFIRVHNAFIKQELARFSNDQRLSMNTSWWVLCSSMIREFFTPERKRWIAPFIHLASDSML